jgi:hypothetical protein
VHSAQRPNANRLAACAPQISPRAIPVNTADINATRDWIRSADPSMEQIEQRANGEGR